MVKRQDASTGQIVETPDKQKNASKKQDTIHVKIYSPFKTYFNDEAQSISALNDTGPFDVLPQHHRFMTLLNPCDLVVRTLDGRQQKIRITRGIMHVRKDTATVFLDV